MMGFYFDDLFKFLDVMYCFVDFGNMVVLIEYNFDIIKFVDWVIEMGFEVG